MTLLNALGLDGRLALKPYLQIGLTLLAAKLLLMLAVTLLVVKPDAPGGADGTQTARLIFAASDLLMLWPWIMLNVRRAHDRGASGLLEAFAVVYATVCWAVPDAWAASALPGWLTPVLNDVVGSTLLTVSLVQQLDYRAFGDNRYGPATTTSLPAPAA